MFEDERTRWLRAEHAFNLWFTYPTRHTSETLVPDSLRAGFISRKLMFVGYCSFRVEYCFLFSGGYPISKAPQ
jgi:hypothetical protein